MKRLDAGTVSATPPSSSVAGVLPVDQRWAAIIGTLCRMRPLRPAQLQAIAQHGILESRQNVVICAPPNSGKSLIGHLLLLDAVLRGRRAILLEPLRALAQEQADELTELVALLPAGTLSKPPRVSISTGDYRLEGELPDGAPPKEGEIIVATPERLDAIVRNPGNAEWMSSVGAIVIDEAHLLSDPRRGPTLELLVASMLSMPAPPRIALLSATVGDPERLREWLAPCQLITSTARTALNREVWELDEADTPDEVLASAIRDALMEPDSAIVVFVYRRQAADVLAQELEASLGIPVNSYHSGQSANQRMRNRSEFQSGGCRCLVSTTALAMGVNLPATHIFVRDSTFFGFGKLRVDELLQILGRAGRGERRGCGVVLLRSGDDWDADELANLLLTESLPPLRSSFEVPAKSYGNRSPTREDPRDIAAAGLIASCLARAGDVGVPKVQIAKLIGNTLGAPSLATRVDSSLRWLTEPSHAIAFSTEQQQFRLTALGQAGVRSMLPLNYLAGLGRLLRDLISLDTDARFLHRWSALDHLVLASVLSDRAPKLRRFSEALVSQIDGWHENLPVDEKSLLFAEWIMGAAGVSKVDELFGSLGIPLGPKHLITADSARKRAYVAMLAAIVLDERARAVPLADIERRWGLTALEGTDESWRDSTLWLIAGHANLLDVRAFYHHLREHCAATPEQVKATKQTLARMRSQAYDLLEGLKYCSPLGAILRGIRSIVGTTANGPLAGLATIRKLEAAGISNLAQIRTLSVDALVQVGLQKRYAKQIRAYIDRRMR
jgi:superfamily II DNA/RNA helicase